MSRGIFSRKRGRGLAIREFTVIVTAEAETGTNVGNARERRGWIEFFRRVASYYYWKVIRNSGSPDYIARGAAVGIFVGFFIPMGFQIVAVIPLAFLFRAAKIPAVVLTFVSNYVTAVVIYPVQCYVGSYLIFNPLRWSELTDKMKTLLTEQTLDSLTALGTQIVLSFFAGGLLFGVLSAIPVYWVAFRLVTRYRTRRAEKRAEKEAAKKL